MSYVVFWGHGKWEANENPTHTYVPGGCTLYFFARHREEIGTDRMREILARLCTIDVTGRETEFVREMKDARNIRAVKAGGTRVRNYRLFPSDEATSLPSEFFEASADLFEHVETSVPAGETLDALFKTHRTPGTIFLWVPCRAVDEGGFVDIGNHDRIGDVEIGATRTDDFGHTINYSATGRMRAPDYSNKVR